MKRANKIFLGIGCCLLLLLSWVAALSVKSDAGKQEELIHAAAELVADGIYVRAAPLLEEAAGYHAKHTLAAETDLKQVYRQLLAQQGYRRKYTDLLAKQMARQDAPAAVFDEAARYYLENNNVRVALGILRDGIQRTADPALTEFYEQSRYGYRSNHAFYDEVTSFYQGTIQVQRGGLWGVASSNGKLMIPCEFDQISTYSQGRAIARQGDTISAVDGVGNRIALLKEAATAFKNYGNDRVPLLMAEGWRRATGEFTIGAAAFEDMGMYAGGYTAAMQGGRWGVIDTGNEWYLLPEYDEIIQNELGQCYAQNAVFARQGDRVTLFVEGQPLDGSYEDARPFADGYAAVKRDGKWGFIDTAGTVVIEFQYDDARSFGQHLAAVKIDALWGYISKSGALVIEPVFDDAKSFSNGSAPVKAEGVWQFITLLEYEKGVSL